VAWRGYVQKYFLSEPTDSWIDRRGLGKVGNAAIRIHLGGCNLSLRGVQPDCV